MGFYKIPQFQNFTDIRLVISALIHAEREIGRHDEANGSFLLLRAPMNSINREQQHCMAYYLSVVCSHIVNNQLQSCCR
jgi:hypothetical protein